MNESKFIFFNQIFEFMAIAPKLAHCWHPVAYSKEVASDKPFGTFLLNQAVVIWRSEAGVHAMRDLCIHRGTALSLGWVKNNCLVCPYHAWQYDKTGACVFIPQAPNTAIPAKANTPKYHCVVQTGPFNWKSDASRQVENFTDFGHFPWVHPGLLGDPERPEVPHCVVERKGAVLHYSIVRPEAQNTSDFPVFGNEVVDKPTRRSVYELHLPYTIVLRLGWGSANGMVYFFVSQPMTEDTCRGYCIIGRNYDLDEPDTILQHFEQVIFDQDKRIVESQRPNQVPFDFAEELHLKFDTVAMNYRKAMKAEGLTH
jgi:phenylpropionate dioxygenase-like ring-hydroxylating dioxygenase large terminal subunit